MQASGLGVLSTSFCFVMELKTALIPTLIMAFPLKGPLHLQIIGKFRSDRYDNLQYNDHILRSS